jgi:DNA polymerase (family 10)
MELHFAERYADKIVAALQPMCERIAVAGSIRRRRAVVNDIDLVIEPKTGQVQNIKGRCEETRAAVLMNGELNYEVLLPGNIRLDIFFARPVVEDLLDPKPANFGSILLCRTGSRDHNVWLIGEAKRRGVAWLPYEGVMRAGRIVAAETEEEIFRAIGVEYVKPEHRER